MGKEEKKDRTESNAIKVSAVADILKFQEDKSLEALQEYVIVPFVKVIQGMTDQDLKDQFGEGAAILRPGDVKIGDRKLPFLFVPLFFYTVFRKWADRLDKDQMIVASTYDPESETAKRSRDPELWEEAYENDEDKKYRYVEHLCFIGIIYDGEQAGERCLISFQKGDFKVGRGFASGAQMRKVVVNDETKEKAQVPLWAQVWQMKTSLRESKGNKWWGLDPCAPPEGIESMISPDRYADHSDMYNDLVKAHAANLIRIDGEDDGSESTPEESKDF